MDEEKNILCPIDMGECDDIGDKVIESHD